MKMLYKFDPNTGKYIGAVPAELDKWQTEIAGRECYKGIANAVWEEPPAAEGYTAYMSMNGWELRANPGPKEIQAELTNTVQAYMDDAVKARGYDGIATACTYASSTDATFAAEGAACVAWRDKVWRHCYDALAEVLAGERDIPTAEELIAELPELVW